MRLTPFAILVFGISTGCACAQPINTPQPPPYDAGALLRQIEQSNRLSQMQQMAQKREALPPVMVLNDATLLNVEHFKFNGNKILSTEQLQAVVAPFTNRSLTSQDVQHLTSAVSEAYRQIGWIVQAYIPKQDITGPELTLQVIESIPSSKTPH